MRDLRALVAAGALLLLAGCVVGWFERSVAAEVSGPVAVVRPDGVLGLGLLGWLVLVPLVLAPAVPSSRRAVVAALAACAPGLVFVVLAAALPRREAVSGETIGEVVSDRTAGQALALVGALLVAMGLVTAVRRAPDWAVPPRWAHEDATREREPVTEP